MVGTANAERASRALEFGMYRDGDKSRPDPGGDDRSGAESTTVAMMKLRDAGLTIRTIADNVNENQINEDEYATRTGEPWGPSSVYRILERTASTIAI